MTTSKSSLANNELSGQFVSHFSGSGQGSATAFVQLPDGTKHILGQIPFSGSTSSSLAYGPFNQTGTYVFGICVDEGCRLPVQSKIGFVDVRINGSTIQSHDFIVPRNPPTNYEPAPYTHELL